MNFYLVNVFTKNDKAGNQLAVVFPEKNLSDVHMQDIAKEFNFSETVFIDAYQNLRIFTPKSELPFAGHPSVGAAWTLNHLGIKTHILNLPLGKVKMKASEDGAEITFPGTPTHRDFEGNLSEVLQHCCVKREDVLEEKIKLIHVGPEFLLIPLRSRQALKKAVSPMSYKGILKVYFVFKEMDELYHVRMFSPLLSVPEDPATGSAACALAYFIKTFEEHSTGRAIVYQGLELNRACEMHLHWNEEIHLGGKVRLWAQGQLHL